MRLSTTEKTLFDELCTGALCLTSNAHLANTLVRQFHGYVIEDSAHSYERLDIMSLTNWLQSSFNHHLSQQALQLNNSQEKALWKIMISGEPTHYQQEHTDQCRNAWQLMQQWQQPLNVLSDYADYQTRHFQSLAKEFQQLCTQQLWIDTLPLPTC